MKISALIFASCLLVCCAYGQNADSKVTEADDSTWLKHFYQNPDDKPFDAFWKKVVSEKYLGRREQGFDADGFCEPGFAPMPGAD